MHAGAGYRHDTNVFAQFVQPALQRHDRAADAGADRLDQLVGGVALQHRLRVQAPASETQVDGLAVVHALGQHPQGDIADCLPRQFGLVKVVVARVVQQAHAGSAQFDDLEEAGVDLVQIADTEVELVAAQTIDDLFRAQRRELEMQLWIALGQGREEAHGVDARQRHHAQAQVADDLPAAAGSLGLQAVVGRQQGPGPGQDALAGFSETFKPLAAGYQHQVQLVLQVAQAHGQRRLGDVAQRSGLAEVSGLIQGDEKLELFDVHGAAWQVVWG
ncbi:hypothetical protein D3C81_674330 [compost metagenome]